MLKKLFRCALSQIDLEVFVIAIFIVSLLVTVCMATLGAQETQVPVTATEAQLKNLQVIIQQQQAQIAELLKRTATAGDHQAAETLAAAFTQAAQTPEAKRCIAAGLPARIAYSPQAGLTIVCERLVQPRRRSWRHLWLR